MMRHPTRTLTVLAAAVVVGAAASALLPGTASAHASRRTIIFSPGYLLPGEVVGRTFFLHDDDWVTARFELTDGRRHGAANVRRPSGSTFTVRKGHPQVESNPEDGRYRVVLSNTGLWFERVRLRIRLSR